ncbi:MAG: class I SAM-dependent methyltransferase [candidate division Zixibacteria bacterium]|nr:class I SAM-dependent methyltransferase [candidate division Zixibacteria bacterium]
MCSADNIVSGKVERLMSPLSEFWLKHKEFSKHMDDMIERDYTGFKEINKKVLEQFGIELKGIKILEIGCGQLYPHVLLFGKENDITGIDLDIILTKWSPLLMIKILFNSGIRRFGKSVIRKALFDKKYYRTLEKRSGMKQDISPKILALSADKTGFNDNEFDFITSYNVFEHVDNTENVVMEMKRILKPGGIFALVINIFTSLSGGHNCFNLLETEGTQDRIPPWDHLRNRHFPPESYLNKLRITDYKRIFEDHFKELYYSEEEEQRNRRYLTDEVLEELPDYSVHELLVNEFWILGRKSKLDQ